MSYVIPDKIILDNKKSIKLEVDIYHDFKIMDMIGGSEFAHERVEQVLWTEKCQPVVLCFQSALLKYEMLNRVEEIWLAGDFTYDGFILTVGMSLKNFYDKNIIDGIGEHIKMKESDMDFERYADYTLFLISYELICNWNVWKSRIGRYIERE